MLAEKIGSQLSISEIKAVDFQRGEIKRAWDEMIEHAKRKELKEITKIRTLVQSMIQEELMKAGFIHPPLYTFSTCVDPLNHATESAKFNYYGQECTLMQSLIFHKMAILSLTEIEKVFWISPNVRKEKFVKDKRRYSTEFTQVDFESSVLDMESCLELIEKIVIRVTNDLIDLKGDIIERISGRALKKISSKLLRFDAEEEAKRRFIDVDDLEKVLSEELEHPFILTNLKREAYDRRDEITGKYLNYDICLPKTGEILSGAEREFEADRLTMRMEELDYPLEYFEPILKLAREHGLKATTGAGFGIERWVRGILLLDDIAEVYPFKRSPEDAIIF